MLSAAISREEKCGL